ncbi:MAG TPA: hypothetical protein VEF06_00550 [Bryobacteraceae bacterium]|nr:hypothetical protein [Bryobacteraceae bacterium]
MRLFAITPQGLLAISLSVAGLWGCLALERINRQHATRDLYASQVTLARLRERAVPVSQPANPFHSDRPSMS